MKKYLLTTFLFLLLALTVFSQVNLQQGLVASYPFTGNANDDSGNNLNGTVTGATLSTDRFGQTGNAYTFSSGYISVPTNSLFNTGDELSVSAWVKLTSATNNQKVIGRCDVAFTSGFLMGVQSGHLYPEIWNSQGTHYQMTAAGTITANQWTHVCITYANSLYFTAYVNGIAVDSVPVAAYPMGNNTDNLVIGIAPWNLLNFPVGGAIDDIRIYNRQINPAEVQALYNMPVGVRSAENLKQPFVYPNPSGGLFNLFFPETVRSISVMNELGAVVYQSNELKENYYSLDLRFLEKGIYFMSLKTESGIVRKEIIIN